MSFVDLDAAVTTVRGLRPGDLLDGEPVAHHTLILDGLDDGALVMGSPSQLDSLARAMRRETSAITATVPPAPTPLADRADEQLPPMLDYVVIDADGCIRIVSAVLSARGPLPILQSAVGGYIQLVPTLPRLDGYVHEEGRLIGLPPNLVGALVHQRLTGGQEPWPILGPLVFVGSSSTDAVSLTTGQRRLIVQAWAAVIYQR